PPWGFPDQARPCLPDRWQLERLLGVGGQAQVWLALDRRLGEMVALKVFNPDLPPEALRRLSREVKLGRELRHPNLVRVYELVEAGDRLAVSMEWLPGGTMKQRLQNLGPLPVPEVVRVADEVLKALAFLHEKGIVHRDVKPSNLLLDADQGVHLGDLGLARGYSSSHDRTQTTTTLGTINYMSPEQLAGHALTPAVDLYSLGVTLFELLTGELPFCAQSEVELALLKLKARPPDPRQKRPDCPRWLARFISRLLEASPRDRFPNAAVAWDAFSRRRDVHSPRTVRETVFKAAMAAALGTVGIFAWQKASRLAETTAAYSVSWRGPELLARDPMGHVLWRYRCQAPVAQTQVVDLEGDGKAETVVATKAPENQGRRDQQLPPGEILILTADGNLRSRFVPDWQAAAPQAFVAGTLVPAFICADLDANGTREVLVSTHHRTLGWSALHVFWPETQNWQLVLHHIGWFMNVLPIPDSRAPRLRFLANNGPLLEAEVVGEVQLSPRDQAAQAAGNPLVGVPWTSVPFSWYTPVGQLGAAGLDSGPRFLLRPDGRSFLQGAGRHLEIDRWGNPLPGPNAGKDLSALRLRLLAQ
ncbi:MAG: serine/threonine-protein kinase, partial [Thermoanaerobaculum sp.]